MSEKNKKSKKSIKRELVEWALLVGVVLVLFLTGLHTEVFGRLQQVILWTGAIQPDTEIPIEETEMAGYHMELISPEGAKKTLREFEDKVIFLNYWATWCPPCIAEMPNIQALYEQYRDDNRIAFVMVSLDEEQDKAREFVRRKEFTFPIYYLGSQRPESLQSTTIPTTFVIDREGRIVVSRKGMANYNTDRFKHFLETLLAEVK